jgi:hypothetical protein
VYVYLCYIFVTSVNGYIYAYALDFDGIGGNYTRVASFYSGMSAIMALEFDSESGYLWAVCDNKVSVVTVVR